jgi:hypothetical protein
MTLMEYCVDNPFFAKPILNFPNGTGPGIGNWMTKANRLRGCEFFDMHQGRQQKVILTTARQPRQDFASAIPLYG